MVNIHIDTRTMSVLCWTMDLPLTHDLLRDFSNLDRSFRSSSLTVHHRQDRPNLLHLYLQTLDKLGGLLLSIIHLASSVKGEVDTHSSFSNSTGILGFEQTKEGLQRAKRLERGRRTSRLLDSDKCFEVARNESTVDILKTWTRCAVSRLQLRR